MADVLLHDAVGQARAHLQAGDYSDAFALAQHILHFYPKHIETYALLAQISLAINDLAGANDLLRRVLSADPENIVALSGMGLISETQDKYDEALWYLERAYEIQPSNDELRGELLRVRELYYGTAPSRVELTSGALARVYARQGQYAQAISEFRRLLRNDSKRYDARVGLAETLYLAGRTDEAAQVAQSIMADAPFALKPNLILGALWTENAVPEGQQYLQRAHQLDPEHRVARDLLGEHFDGTQAPRLPVLGEGITQPLPTLPEIETFDMDTPDSEIARAALLLSEIERDQELETGIEEPHFADLEALDRVENQAEQPVELEAGSEPAAETTPVPDSESDTLLASPAEPAQAPVPPVKAALTTLEEILAAERLKAEEEKAVPPPPKPAAKFAERSTRKSGEGLSADTIAAAAAALATSIALDKSNQPSPTRRGHPAIPKVRPVIRSAQEKLPGWLRLSTTPANASASFDAPTDSTPANATPVKAAEPDRPDWLVQAEAVSVQENNVPSQDTALPEWLKPPTPPETVKPPVETPSPAEIPSWLRDEPPVETAPISQATPITPAAAMSSVVALPEWLTDETADTPAIAPTPPTTPPVAESWTNAAEEKTSAEPAWQKAVESETPVMRGQAASETNQAETPIAASPLDTLPPPAATIDIAQPPDAQIEPAQPIPEPIPAPTPETASKPEPVQQLPAVQPADVVESAPPPAPVVEERSQTQALPDSGTMLQMARDKRASGDLKGALDLYERVMHRRPNYLDQITLDLQEIIQGGNAPTSANRLLGEAYAMVGRFKESLEQYRIAMGK